MANDLLRDKAIRAGLRPGDVAERAAIMEFDGGMPRWFAEDYALGKIDWWRLHLCLKRWGRK